MISGPITQRDLASLKRHSDHCCFLLIQERELLGRITELQEEVSRRKNHIAQLDHQIHTLNENISTLTKELELKGKEVLKIRSEANQQIRYDSAET